MVSSHPFQIDRPTFDVMRAKLIEAAKGIYTKQEFLDGPWKAAQDKMRRIIEANAQANREEQEEKDIYILPPTLTIEEHLFNLTFQDKQRPICVIDHAFRQYNPSLGYWELIPDEELEQRILLNAEKAHYPDTKNGPGRSLATSGNVERTIKFAGKKLFTSQRCRNNRHLIAFRNVTVCTKTGAVQEHSQDNFITTALPYDYKPFAPCPEPMLRYIQSSFGKGMEEYVRAALGLVLDLTAPDRFIHCVGPSGSGKGVFTRLTMKFFGPELVGSPNNFKIFGNADQVHQYLSGRRLMVIDDIVGFVGEEVASFYTAVERTAMNARCLFKPKGYSQSFDIRYAVCSTGPLGTRFSNSKGWERRVFPLPTTVRQSEDENLELELENCIADIISWALCMDKQLRDNILRNPARYNPKAESYFIDSAHSSSSAWAFIDECLTPIEPHVSDTANHQIIDDARIYNAYKAFCAATGRQPMSMDGLKHEMRQTLPLNWTERRNGGKIPRRFVYIGLIESAFEISEFGNTSCNLINLSWDGVAKFKTWGQTYGHCYPYDPENLQELPGQTQQTLGVTAEDSPVESVEPVVPTAPIETPEAVELPVGEHSNNWPYQPGAQVQATYQGKTPKQIREWEAVNGIPRGIVGTVVQCWQDSPGGDWVVAVQTDTGQYAEPVGHLSRVFQ